VSDADLDRRLQALATAADLADGRLDAGDVAAARAVVARAGQRLGLGLMDTVVALAGPTGAGKSSLFNALAGAELARVGVRRPTTSAAAAAVWGTGGDALLDWLDVRLRHAAADGGVAGGLDGLVLLDLPDFDSVEHDHRLEADRIIGLADLLVWVVDPQKYADATLHDRYLRPLARHGDAMAVVLNHADRLDEAAAAACRADLDRLLHADGLDGVPVLAVSARTGLGLADLREELRERVAAREAAVARLAADVEDAAAALGAGCGRAPGGEVTGRDAERLDAALAEAAGVPTVVRAVARAHRRRGALATGWPFVRWLRRLRPDPLRRLRLPDRAGDDGGELARTSLPGPSAAERARADSAMRGLAHGAAGELPEPWPGLVRRVATAHEDELADRLDRAVAGVDLRMRRPLWWRVAGVLQTVLATAVAAGALWLLALAGLAWLRVDDAVPTPEVRGIPLPTLLLGGGALLGLLLALLARVANGVSARRRARAAERALRRRVHDVAAELVVAPVEAELAARADLCAAVAVAAGTAPGRRRLLRR
jgi:GTP-binding protein EngB required for normal cell division